LALADVIDQTDPPLIQRAQRYEREALEELFDRGIAGLGRLCQTLTGSPDEAERLVRHGLDRALDALPRFRGDGYGFPAWLLRMGAGSVDRMPRPADELRAAFQRLPRRSQEVLGLRVLARLDSDRVAQATRRSAGDVRSLLAGALRRLRGGPYQLPERRNLEAFDIAVDRVLAGGDPDREGAKLLAPADAPALLGLVKQLAEWQAEPLAEPATARLRTIFLAGGAERRATWIQRHQAVAMVPGLELRRGSKRISRGAVVMLIALLAVTAGGLLAIFSMFASPDAPSYPVKRFAETVLLGLNRDPVSRADLELKLASTRSREAEDMAVGGRGDLAVAMMRDRYQLLRQAGVELATSPQRDARWTSERNQFSSQASQSTEVLQNDLKASHQPAAANQVRALAQQFQRDRTRIDAGLGSPAAAGPPSPPPPTPTS
jgi:DNA-directed RNA polymerase specialized sigma24 family protein